jgi:hypothetical protein
MRYLLIAVLLAGCATPEQRADRMISRFGPICDKLGYEKDSDKWRDCVVSQSNAPRPAVSKSTTCQTYGNTTTCN